MNLDHVVRQITSEPGLAPFLDEPLAAIGVDGISRGIRRRLERALKRTSHPTVRDVATVARRWDEQDVIGRWLLSAARRYEPQPEADPEERLLERHVLRSGVPLAELRAWAARRGVVEVLAYPTADVLRVVGESRLLRFAPWLRDRPLEKTLSEGIPEWMPISEWDRQQVEEALQGYAYRCASAVGRGIEMERARARQRSRPPTEPALENVWARVREARESLRRKASPWGLEDHAVHELLEDPPGLRFDTIGSQRISPAIVALDGEVSVASSLQGLAVLDRTLDLLTAPEHAEARAAMLQVLSVPSWERGLRHLDRLLAPSDPNPSDDKRLVGWRFVERGGQLALHPVRCRTKKTGPGFVLRNESPAGVPDAIVTEPVDRLLLHLLEEPSEAAVGQGFAALVGHPRVFSERGTEPIPVRAGRFDVRLHHAPGGVRLRPAVDGEVVDIATFLAWVERGWLGGRLVVADDARVRVFAVAPAAIDLLRGWRGRDTHFPSEALPELLGRLPALMGRVPLELDGDLRGTRIEGDVRPLLRLSWGDEGLGISAWARPLPDALPQPPGEGPDAVYAVRDGRAVHVVRDLDRERAMFREALALLGLSEGFEWRVAGLEAALACVEALQRHATSFQVEWSGEIPRVREPIGAKALRVRVDQGRDWFGLDGTALVDGAEVPLRALLEAVEEGRTYLQVGQGSWASIGAALRGQLEAAAAAAAPDRRGSRRLSPLHAPLVQALADEGVEVEAPPDWLALADHLREARTLQAALPEGLRATLRDYQEVGFRWLASLAHWAPGAVLADDMGLGKTVQAIALLLHRRAGGPALVVAPTSVVHNWQREIDRFAAGLRVRTYAGAARADLLDDLAPGDVVLTTYGVLTRDEEALAAVPFHTLVLDEAQAIKNPAAQRSKAVFRLHAEFRVALSGTPVENHTGELWSLFRAVAPGLLGGWERFREAFALPIEARGDTRRRATLARLVRPFVLRRTKREVASELPDRVESVVEVTLTPAERALYDRSRLSALARVSEAASGTKGRFQVLAELTRLRQLACHPRLLDPGSPIASSKLRAVLRVLHDLRENGHRALVFSQFTRHLGLVREALEAAGFRIAWLEGSTPADRRVAEVDAFQRGEADVFLLSLGAGGTGLNLTAASYVLHLDPWWNPAKEDQATDRAHRIGQDKAVTVYRFVARGTIEEQIVALHDEKRELAEAILAGTGAAARASVEDLVALLGAAKLDEIDEEEPEEDDAVPVPSGPSPAALRATLDLPSVQAAFLARLDEERASGALKTDGTVRSHARVIEHLLEWLGDDVPTSGEALLARAREYGRLAKAGELPWKSDRVYAGAALRRLAKVLEACR